MEIINYGEDALLINFEQTIDLAINQKVITLANLLEEIKLEGLRYTIPAYCSLTIVFDPVLNSHQQIRNRIAALDISPTDEHQEGRKLLIPVCYDIELGLDLEELSIALNMSIEEIIDIHTSRHYHIYMMGFIPGFAYMGKVDRRLNTSRKLKPKLDVPTGAVAIAGLQTGIYPMQSPGGWNILGQTPIPVFDSRQDDPFLFSLGDQVKFRSIVKEEYHEIVTQLEKDTYNPANLMYVE